MEKNYKKTAFLKIQFLILLALLFISKGIQAQACMAAFTPSGCAGGNVQFLNTSTGVTSGVMYAWNFGDGATSNNQNPAHTYTANGIYNVCLYLWDFSTSCTSSICQTVAINCVTTGSCMAAFNSYSCVGGTKWFNNTSTGTTSNTLYYWTFGDGGNSYSQNPSHTYASNGIYNVCLTIHDSIAGCMSTSCQTVNINCVTTPTCNAAFTPSGCVSGNVQFWNTSAVPSSTTSYYWTFGDGGNSTAQSPSHTYTTNGIYNVCLTIQDSSAFCSSTTCQTVNINCAASGSCMAAFTPSGCASGNVQFWNTSTGTTGTTFYYWTFGDGGFSYSQNTSHTYTANGVYTVCLSLQDSTTNCNTTVCHTVNVNCVSSSPCTAAFSPAGCVGGNMQFSNNSTGITSMTYYYWTFGDGGISNNQNPSHTYTANGVYNVCLNIQDSTTACNSTICHTVNVNCVSSGSCMAAFTPSGCVGGNMQFWNTSAGTSSMTYYYWTFGDGGTSNSQNASHTYTANGVYNVCLNIQDTTTFCNSTVCQTVNINCVSTGSCLAAFNSFSCVAGTVYFSNSSTGTSFGTNYSWAFGDGGVAYVPNPSHTYSANGIYTVCLTIQDSMTNCMSVTCKTVNVNCITTGLGETISGLPEIKLYPNPGDGIFKLEISLRDRETAELIITNVLGQEIYRSKEDESGLIVKTIDLSEVSNGTYFIRISTGNGEIQKKIIITK